eukprot:3100395-Prymnesium_polylepis.1
MTLLFAPSAQAARVWRLPFTYLRISHFECVFDHLSPCQQQLASAAVLHGLVVRQQLVRTAARTLEWLGFGDAYDATHVRRGDLGVTERVRSRDTDILPSKWPAEALAAALGQQLDRLPAPRQAEGTGSVLPLLVVSDAAQPQVNGAAQQAPRPPAGTAPAQSPAASSSQSSGESSRPEDLAVLSLPQLMRPRTVHFTAAAYLALNVTSSLEQALSDMLVCVPARRFV